MFRKAESGHISQPEEVGKPLEEQRILNQSRRLEVRKSWRSAEGVGGRRSSVCESLAAWSLERQWEAIGWFKTEVFHDQTSHGRNIIVLVI